MAPTWRWGLSKLLASQQTVGCQEMPWKLLAVKHLLACVSQGNSNQPSPNDPQWWFIWTAGTLFWKFPQSAARFKTGAGRYWLWGAEGTSENLSDSEASGYAYMTAPSPRARCAPQPCPKHRPLYCLGIMSSLLHTLLKLWFSWRTNHDTLQVVFWGEGARTMVITNPCCFTWESTLSAWLHSLGSSGLQTGVWEALGGR